MKKVTLPATESFKFEVIGSRAGKLGIRAPWLSKEFKEHALPIVDSAVFCAQCDAFQRGATPFVTEAA